MITAWEETATNLKGIARVANVFILVLFLNVGGCNGGKTISITLPNSRLSHSLPVL